MSKHQLRVLLSVIAAAATTFFGSAANAGFYGSNFDPDFFLGSSVFFVPDSCLDPVTPGFQSVNGAEDPCQGVAMTSTSADATDSDGNTAHLTFAGFDTADITGMVLADSEPFLRGINSDLIPLVCTGAEILCLNFNWFIQFDSGLPQSALTFFSASADSSDAPGLNNSVTLWQLCGECNDPRVFDVANNVTFFKITQAPEPGTLALILGGLGAGWLARKRKTAA